MKMIIATFILTLAAAQSHAEGFYQMVAGDAPQAPASSSWQSPTISETPLYQQVMAQSKVLAKRETRTLTIAETPETPLYQSVHGS